MARPSEPPQSPRSMTASQLERRRRLLDAVVELVDEGRTDDLAMKDIADRADVALGTVYRYFSSKDHLIAEALVDWARGLDDPARRVAVEGPPADRLVLVLRNALRAYQRQPTFARLLVMVANSSDPFASESYAELGTVVYGVLGEVLVDIDPDTARRILGVIGAVWYHCLVEWVNGRMTIADVNATLESACHLLLPTSVPVPVAPVSGGR